MQHTVPYDSVLLLSTMQQGNNVKLRSALLGEGFDTFENLTRLV